MSKRIINNTQLILNFSSESLEKHCADLGFVGDSSIGKSSYNPISKSKAKKVLNLSARKLKRFIKSQKGSQYIIPTYDIKLSGFQKYNMLQMMRLSRKYKSGIGFVTASFQDYLK